MRFSVSPSRLSLSLMAMGWATAASAASLGDMQLRSSLGERFEGSIAVVADDDESLSTRCFRLVAGDGDGMQLQRAQLLYEDGQLYIQGSQTIDEPVLNVTVRLACPGREAGEFQRDYTLLLDPRGYAPVVALKDAVRPAARSMRRALPALGGVWRSESGDSIEQIARRYFPRDEQERAWLIDELHGLNPDLPQNSRARLDPGVAVNLPSPRSRPSAQRGEQLLAQESTPVLRIEPLPTPRPVSAAGSAPRSQGDPDEFRLRLSSPELSLGHQPSMTPEESLRLRENLLLLESDDQTAQLMQLKYQIAQMEKQLAELKARPAQPETAAEGESSPMDGMGSWLWAGLLVLVLLPGGYAYWRWRERRDAEEYEAFSLATSLEPRFGPTTARPSTGLGDPAIAVLPRSGMHDLAHNIAQMANDWHNDEVDVVLPGNVSEEAQLLIDHGLVQQAVNLLSHEIEQHPTTLALWMKLFDVLRMNEMVQQFQERAVAFRLQFASDALWQQVQAQGRELDPGNPLYEAIDDADAIGVPRMPEAKSANALSSLTTVTVAGPPSILEFRLDPLPAAEIATEVAPPMLPASEVEEVEALAVDSGSEPLFSPADFMVATEVNQQGMERAEVDPAEFVTDDAVLKPVAELLIKGENNSVFRLLEETLYNGTLEQRQTALRWLDKLFPIKHR